MFIVGFELDDLNYTLFQCNVYRVMQHRTFIKLSHMQLPIMTDMYLKSGKYKLGPYGMVLIRRLYVYNKVGNFEGFNIKCMSSPVFEEKYVNIAYTRGHNILAVYKTIISTNKSHCSNIVLMHHSHVVCSTSLIRRYNTSNFLILFDSI